MLIRFAHRAANAIDLPKFGRINLHPDKVSAIRRPEHWKTFQRQENRMTILAPPIRPLQTISLIPSPFLEPQSIPAVRRSPESNDTPLPEPPTTPCHVTIHSNDEDDSGVQIHWHPPPPPPSPYAPLIARSGMGPCSSAPSRPTTFLWPAPPTTIRPYDLCLDHRVLNVGLWPALSTTTTTITIVTSQWRT